MAHSGLRDVASTLLRPTLLPYGQNVVFGTFPELALPRLHVRPRDDPRVAVPVRHFVLVHVDDAVMVFTKE